MYGTCGEEQFPLVLEQRLLCLLEWDQNWLRFAEGPNLALHHGQPSITISTESLSRHSPLVLNQSYIYSSLMGEFDLGDVTTKKKNKGQDRF